MRKEKMKKKKLYNICCIKNVLITPDTTAYTPYFFF